MPFILAFNSGSSTCKFGVFDQGPGGLVPCLRGRIETHGAAPRLLGFDPAGTVVSDEAWAGTSAADLLSWLEARLTGPIAAVGHRVVHGGPRFGTATPVTEAVLAAVAALSTLAPLHQSRALAAVSALGAARPGLPQVLSFDTAFHAGHDPTVDRFALPRVWEARGLRRYGFHGLSYEYLAG
ncbi:acetate kinase, partial [Pseudogymnoascus destructans 20631-21]